MADDSIVMLKREVGSRDTSRWVGCARCFVEATVPGCPQEDPVAVFLVNAEWYKHAPPLLRSHVRIGCPVVMRQTLAPHEACLWECSGIEPVPVGLAPYLKAKAGEVDDSMWMVITAADVECQY